MKYLNMLRLNLQNKIGTLNMRFLNLGKKLASNVGMIAIAATLYGCAAVPTAPEERAIFDEINDPYEPFNRSMFDFNMAMDEAIFEPVATGYDEVMPTYLRERISNLLDYVQLPIIFLSQLLQGEMTYAGDTMGRFMINTVALGFNDPATEAGIPNRKADFGQTFGKWGADEGPYLVLPLLGSYNTRHGVGDIAQLFVNPVSQWEMEKGNQNWGYTHTIIYGIDWRAKNLERIKQLRESSLDFYATARSAYRQKRRSMINGSSSDDLNDPLEQAQAITDDFEDPDEEINQTASSD